MLRLAVRRLGYELHRIDRSALSPDGAYDVIVPRATYSPWNLNQAFTTVYDIIESSTLVDRYRCYDLWKLVEQSAKLPAGDLIEVGVWRGGTGALIARQSQNCEISGHVYLCDTFAGVVKAGAYDSSYRGGEHSDTTVQDVEALLNRLNVKNARLLKGIFPDETAMALQESTFRFCHIDVDVYESAQDILAWIWNRLVPGGIVVYDDFGFKCCDGIARHVEEQVAQRDRLVMHNLNGHGVIVKL